MARITSASDPALATSPDAGQRIPSGPRVIRNRLKDYARHNGECPTCKRPLPDGWPNQSMAELVASGLVDPNELHDD